MSKHLYNFFVAAGLVLLLANFNVVEAAHLHADSAGQECLVCNQTSDSSADVSPNAYRADLANTPLPELREAQDPVSRRLEQPRARAPPTI